MRGGNCKLKIENDYERKNNNNNNEFYSIEFDYCLHVNCMTFNIYELFVTFERERSDLVFNCHNNANVKVM